MRLAHVTQKQQRLLTFFFFLIVPVTLFVASYVYPIGYTFFLSLREWDGISASSDYVGFQNYIELFGDERFYNALFNNIRWLIFYLTCPTALGLGLALLVDGRMKGEAAYKVIIFLPYVITPVAVAAMWRWIYLPEGGLLSVALKSVGLEAWGQNWLGDPDIVNYALMGATLWWMTGFSFIVFLAGLRNIPAEYIEAARIDGASAWTIFRRITFPQLWPSTILVVGIFGIDAMRVFDIVWAMTMGGPARASEVLATQLYDVAFAHFQMGQASAIGVCQLLLSALLIFPYIYYISGRVEEISQ